MSELSPAHHNEEWSLIGKKYQVVWIDACAWLSLFQIWIYIWNWILCRKVVRIIYRIINSGNIWITCLEGIVRRLYFCLIVYNVYKNKILFNQLHELNEKTFLQPVEIVVLYIYTLMKGVTQSYRELRLLLKIYCFVVLTVTLYSR